MAKKRVTIPESLVNTFLDVWNDENGESVERWEINSGWCYQFAVVVRFALGSDVHLYSDMDGGHCWVKIGDYFYDSDHLKGVKRPLSMSYSGDDWKGPVSIRTVQRVWHDANSGPVQMRTIRRVVNTWKANQK